MSKVYFTDMRAAPGNNLLQKLKKLMKNAGFEGLELKDKFVAIKIHFGEPGNLSFLRPNYARVVADYVKELGGKPFLTDCNTLYVGGRKNALDHIDAAYENGFTPLSTGVQVIIADGLRGTEERLVKIGGEYIKEAKIGSAIVDADVVISLNHFKGHEMTGFGGALKNIGMGSGSRAGKMEMHSDGKPIVYKEVCTGCKRCTKICAHNAISFDEHKKAVINHDKCVGCGRCMGFCNYDAIANESGTSGFVLNCKIAEYTKAVLLDKQHFHINIATDISPNCDCHAENDAPIIPNVGMFTSLDPVAIDIASAELCNKMPANTNSQLGDMLKKGCTGHDHFNNSATGTSWIDCIDHAAKIGLGSKEYELITK